MDATYWHKQPIGTPLFPDLLWSRPENRSQAGKLLIASGSAAGFAVAGQAFATAQIAGAGTVRMLLPELLRHSIPKPLQHEVEFAPSVAHGSFSKQALGELLASEAWADAVLLPGGIGRNSETSVVLDQFVQKYPGLVVIAEDALDVFIHNPNQLFKREETIIVADFSQLQKMWHLVAPGQEALKFDMPLQQLVGLLHQATLQVACLAVTNHHNTLLVAYQGNVSTTPSDQSIWRVDTAAKAAVWAMQNPAKLFAAVTTAVYKD